MTPQDRAEMEPIRSSVPARPAGPKRGLGPAGHQDPVHADRQAPHHRPVETPERGRDRAQATTPTLPSPGPAPAPEGAA